jgi:hypothetical protein
MPPDITDVVALITIPASDVAPRLKALRAHHPLATIPLDTIPEPAALPPPPPPPPPLPLRILRTIGAIVLGALGGFIVGMVLPFIITPALITVGIGGSDLDASTRLFEQVFRITTWGMAACGTLIGALLGWGGRTATNTAWTALGGGIVAFVLAMLGMLGFLDPDQQQYGSRRRRK